jgi:hypothetical protein
MSASSWPKWSDQEYDAPPWDNGDPAEVVPIVADRPTWRSLDQIPDDPPGPLLLDMLEPAGPTLACASPGVGKGTTAAWLTCELQRLGRHVAVYDAERRPREWSRRIAGLGGDRSEVTYFDPADLGRKHIGRPLWDAEPALKTIIRDTGSDVLIVDSILPSVGVGEERLRTDAQAPYLYVAALDALGIPTLSLGHPPKGQPEGDPFGSMSWVAAMRLTWIGTAGERDAHQIRWRPRKRNERGHIASFLLTVRYAGDGRPSEATREDDEETTREWILAALVSGPRTVADLAEELLDEAAEAPSGGGDLVRRTEERIGRTVRRLAHEGLTAKAGKDGRAVRWTLPLV